MIAFLLIVYCAVLFVLVKIKVLKPTLPVKLSPILWLLILLVGLFIPMLFWAPSGNVILTQQITRMTPRVSGRIVKIHVQPNQAVEKGTPLLTVDPRPYQDTVDAYTAQLAAAKEAENAVIAAVTQAKAQRDGLKAQLDAAINNVVKAKAQRDEARSTVSIYDESLKENPGSVSKLKYEQAVQTLAGAEANVKVAVANEQNIRISYESESPAAIKGAEANQEKAKQMTLQVQAQLAKAKWDLDETTVYAPSKGYVTDFVVTEGSAVAVVAGGAMINFVSMEEPVYVIAAIQEKNLRYVQLGQPADVVLPLYPGKTLTGKVEEVVWVTGEGQIMPQAAVPMVAQRVKTGGDFAVKIKLDPEWDSYRQPIGAGGMAAIYTDHGKPTHLIRKVMMRMNTWMNYVYQMPGT